MIEMKKSRLFTCELKRHKRIEPALCAVCSRIGRCRIFPVWHRLNREAYLDFVLGICTKFPEKYVLEVIFMAEKQNYVQIVDNLTGKIERVINLAEIEAMSAEEKLALSRAKSLFIVTHRLEPIVKVELKKTVVNHEISFNRPAETPEPIPQEEPVAPPEKPAKGRKGKS